MNRLLVCLLMILPLSSGILAGCQNSGSSDSGRIESNLDPSKAEKDPEKLKKGVEELMAKEKAAKGK